MADQPRRRQLAQVEGRDQAIAQRLVLEQRAEERRGGAGALGELLEPDQHLRRARAAADAIEQRGQQVGEHVARHRSRRRQRGGFVERADRGERRLGSAAARSRSSSAAVSSSATRRRRARGTTGGCGSPAFPGAARTARSRLRAPGRAASRARSRARRRNRGRRGGRRSRARAPRATGCGSAAPGRSATGARGCAGTRRPRPGTSWVPSPISRAAASASSARSVDACRSVRSRAP